MTASDARMTNVRFNCGNVERPLRLEKGFDFARGTPDAVPEGERPRCRNEAVSRAHEQRIRKGRSQPREGCDSSQGE
jgi:hypothetical protein